MDSWLASTDRRQDQQKKAAGCGVRQMDGKHEPDAEVLLGTGRPENGWTHFAGYEAGIRATGLDFSMVQLQPNLHARRQDLQRSG